MTGRATSNVTPFDAWYMPVDNEPHVTLTEQNVEFALSEIIQPTLSIETETSDSIKLEQNPISNTLTILSSNFIENSKISLIDVTGKKVYSTIVNLTDRTKLPINLSSGLYVLQIETRNNTILRTKIIVK